LSDEYRTTEALLAPDGTSRWLPSGCVGQSLGIATYTWRPAPAQLGAAA